MVFMHTAALALLSSVCPGCQVCLHQIVIHQSVHVSRGAQRYFLASYPPPPCRRCSFFHKCSIAFIFLENFSGDDSSVFFLVRG